MDLVSNLPPRIHEILDEGARDGASRLAFTDEYGVVWSYRRLIDTVELVAIEMSRLGIRLGDRIVIVCEDSIAAIVLLYASSRIDAWAVATNARLSQHELELIESDCQPQCVFYTRATSFETDAYAGRRHEASPTISRTQYTKGSDEISIGPPICGVEIKIVGADGHEVEDGLLGELLVRGPNVMLGYYGQPELTAANTLDGHDYLKTGDIVSRKTRDELIVQGQSKELIIRSGFNVYPPEVEAVLNTHPTVLNSTVIRRAVEGNEEIIVFVEPVPRGFIVSNDLFTLIEGQLARCKKLQQIIVILQLPVASNGKIKNTS